ncbi:unnamed protein product, partial [Rotaria socialis]
IGPCSALIYIGDYPTEIKYGDSNIIVETFKKENKAIYIQLNCESMILMKLGPYDEFFLALD